MSLFAAITLATAIQLVAGVGPLTFPDAYYAAGNIYLPQWNIAEPYEAWVDMNAGKSRMDTYNGTARVINRGDETDYGTMYKIVPMTTDNVTNEITCFKIPGYSEGPVVPQGVLPNASLYTFLVNTTFEGKNVSLYLSSFAAGDKLNNYSLFIDSSTGFPVMLYFIGYDRLFGSHYDEYVIKYSKFSPTPPDSSVFEFQDKYTCRSFPGPGHDNPMSENPFFELVGAKPYSFADKDKRVEAEFKDFTQKHSKKYKNDEEMLKRKSAFIQNYRYINSFNRQDRSFKLAVNHLADLNEKELSMMRGVYKTKDSPRGEIYQPRLSSIPPSYDWRIPGAVTQVKDQGICGSCWSFGTTGTLEGSYFIKHGKLVPLSEQALVDCSWGYGNNGCDGGESERSYKWILHQGCIPSEMSYGYLMQDGYCYADEAECGTSISNWYNTPEGNVTALVYAVYEHGPISVAIDASHLSFSFYSHGVYYEPKCGNSLDDLDHQVLAIGYGSLNGEAYFLVKNSWSTYWGNEGFVLMSQKDNNCGIATDASFADVE